MLNSGNVQCCVPAGGVYLHADTEPVVTCLFYSSIGHLEQLTTVFRRAKPTIAASQALHFTTCLIEFIVCWCISSSPGGLDRQLSMPLNTGWSVNYHVCLLLCFPRRFNTLCFPLGIYAFYPCTHTHTRTQMHGKEVGGQVITVNRATVNKSRVPGGGGGGGGGGYGGSRDGGGYGRYDDRSGGGRYDGELIA